ncbi:MAG TPA: hypothetical protein VGM84_10035 [Steroidobacteraceae bacterium]|jgi:hypothetical protein
MLVTAPALDALVKVTQLIGIPVGIAVYGLKMRKERIAREYATYDSLDVRYVEFLKLCLAHPDLDVADTPRPNSDSTSDQMHRERLLFSILISMMERAYLMYKDTSNEVRRKQWIGWNAYIHHWCGRENFATAMPFLARDFDVGFRDYLLAATAQERGRVANQASFP